MSSGLAVILRSSGARPFKATMSLLRNFTSPLDRAARPLSLPLSPARWQKPSSEGTERRFVLSLHQTRAPLGNVVSIVIALEASRRWLCVGPRRNQARAGA